MFGNSVSHLLRHAFMAFGKEDLSGRLEYVRKLVAMEGDLLRLYSQDPSNPKVKLLLEKIGKAKARI